MTLAEAVRTVRGIQDEMLRAGRLRIAEVVTTPERFEALEMVLSACVPCAELREALKCDEPAKPEVGPMQDTESLSGVQALGSSGLAPKRAWPDPTPQMLLDPRFEAVWQCIKRWDISVPDAYSGYEGATGNHARAILDAIHPAWREIERLRSLVREARSDVDVQGIAAIAWRCIRECKDYEGPPVMCPAHQEEARALVGQARKRADGTCPVDGLRCFSADCPAVCIASQQRGEPVNHKPSCGMCECVFLDDQIIRLVEGRLLCADCYNDLPGPE